MPLAGLPLLAPINAPEIWCAGVTYERSRDARLEEAQTDARDVYSLVYEAERPELFMKDAHMLRTVGPGGAIRLRSDSTLDGARAGARDRARRGGRADRGDDRERRLEPRHRRRESALHPAGEDLRRGVRARARARRARRLGRAVADPAADHGRRRRRALRRRDVDRPDEAHAARARGVGGARQPDPRRLGAPDRHRPRAARRLHARARATSSRSRSRASASSRTRSPADRYGAAS